MVFFIRLALSWTQISFNLYVMFIMCKCNYYFDSIIFGIDSLDFYFFYVFFFFFGVAKWFQQKWGLGEKIVIVWVTFIWHSSDFRSYYIWHTFCIYSQEWFQNIVLKLPMFVFEIADIHVSDRIFGKTAVKIFCPIDQLLSHPLQTLYRLLTEQ